MRVGILRPAGGAVYAGGERVASLSPRALAARVAYMPQSRLTPALTAAQLVAHGRYPHLRWGRSLTRRRPRGRSCGRWRASGALAHARPFRAELSGGERQRVYLAMMLAQQAPELLLDEPTAYLDPGAQFRLMELLASLRDEGRAVIAVLPIWRWR